MAGWPYYTSNWAKLRSAKLAQDPLCFACELRGDVELAIAVDHNVPISQGGHPFPSLGELNSLCERCHNEKTSGFDKPGGNISGRRFKGCDERGNPTDPCDGWHTGKTQNKPPNYSIPFHLKASRIPVVLVSGPPGAGKSTYVQEHADPLDLIIDFDVYMRRLGGRKWDQDVGKIKAAFTMRDADLRSLSNRQSGRAWVIKMAPTLAERNAWCNVLRRCSVVVLDVPAEVCKERIGSDPARSHAVASMHSVVDNWWREYEP